MTRQRFYWQQQVVAQHPGIVLNVGSNEDPSRLKETFGLRVLNCDIEDFDSELKRPNKVDILFDAVKDRWPFPDNYANLVVLGDILEHLVKKDIETVLKKAHRVSQMLAITVPKDNRITDTKNNTKNPYMYHQTVVTEQLLRQALKKTSWEVVDWQTVDYEFVSEGYFVLAKRKITTQNLGLSGGPSYT